jgi:hypothetical protein
MSARARAPLGREERQPAGGQSSGCAGWMGGEAAGWPSRAEHLESMRATHQPPSGKSYESDAPKRHARRASAFASASTIPTTACLCPRGQGKHLVRAGRSGLPQRPSVWTMCRLGLQTSASAPRGPSTGECAQDYVPVEVDTARGVSTKGEDDRKCPAQRKPERAGAERESQRRTNRIRDKHNLPVLVYSQLSFGEVAVLLQKRAVPGLCC